ncbi:MAG: hypothetical protein M1833_004248 [Piccolia ochrophora]|nr:MAG: hypothetical protein M1833_004248 [Piccolia ochrophora]
MGSSYFYLEFLLAWLSLLHTSAGYRNPAILALEYTLVPDAVFPTQLHQVIAGYTHLLSLAGDDASRICVSGDSAGATLILSLLLHLGRAQPATEKRTATPGFATLISPWVTLVSAKNRNTRSDYLNADSLHLYARQYSGPNASLDDPMVSPGKCKDVAWWRRAAPQNGLFILYGAEEVLAPEMEELIRLLDRADVSTVVREEEESIHAWPVATLFLGESKAERQKGLRDIVKVIGERMR